MNLEEIREEAERCYWYLWDAADARGRDVKIYLHWTAGRYESTFSDYHFCITGDGQVELTRPLDEPVAATYYRNGGSISIALCCAYDAWAFGNYSYNLGPCPPTAAQIECAAQIVAVLADVLEISIDIYHVMTHAEAADNLDGMYACAPYGPDHGCERWDLSVLRQGDAWKTGGDTLRGKAKWYAKEGNLT